MVLDYGIVLGVVVRNIRVKLGGHFAGIVKDERAYAHLVAYDARFLAGKIIAEFPYFERARRH